MFFFWVGYPLTGKHAPRTSDGCGEHCHVWDGPKGNPSAPQKTDSKPPWVRGSVVADDLGEVPSLPTAFVPYFVDFMVFASLL